MIGLGFWIEPATAIKNSAPKWSRFLRSTSKLVVSLNGLFWIHRFRSIAPKAESSMSLASDDNLIGQTLSHYHIVELLGRWDGRGLQGPRYPAGPPRGHQGATPDKWLIRNGSAGSYRRQSRLGAESSPYRHNP